MKKIMILGASILQLPAIEQAKKMGLEVVAVDMNPDAVGFKVVGVIKEVISTIDAYAVLEAAKKHNICGIITVASDMPMRSVALVAKELSLVGISEDTAIKATNKAQMRQSFYENGVASPRSFNISNKFELIKAIEKIQGKFIIKPADNSGSRGVCLVNNFLEAERVYEYSRKYSRNGDVVVEEFMTGPEVSVELLAIDEKYHVLQVTDKLTTGAPHFVEIGHSQPSTLPKDDLEKIKTLAVQAAKAVGIKNGPAHAEIILTKDGPKMVEIGARMGGGCITTHLVPLSTGINMTKAVIQIALGESPNVESEYEKGSAIRFIIPPVGKVRDIQGVEEAKKICGIKSVEIQCEIGQELGELESGASRIGYVIAQADSVSDAIIICEKALQKIKILV